MSVHPFPHPPMRAIIIRPLAGTQDKWVARFHGDKHREGFRTEAGRLPIVLECCKQPHVRCGLPVIIGHTIEEYLTGEVVA